MFAKFLKHLTVFIVRLSGDITLCLSAAHNTASPACVCTPAAPRSSLSMRPSHKWRSSWLDVQRLEASRACSSRCSTSRLLRLSTEQRMRRASIFSCTCWASSSETKHISRRVRATFCVALTLLIIIKIQVNWREILVLLMFLNSFNIHWNGCCCYRHVHC